MPNSSLPLFHSSVLNCLWVPLAPNDKFYDFMVSCLKSFWMWWLNTFNKSKPVSAMPTEQCRSSNQVTRGLAGASIVEETSSIITKRMGRYSCLAQRYLSRAQSDISNLHYSFCTGVMTCQPPSMSWKCKRAHLLYHSGRQKGAKCLWNLSRIIRSQVTENLYGFPVIFFSLKEITRL